MNTEKIKNKFVLGVLFILPIVVYLFFSSGVNNFARLPVLTESIIEVDNWMSFNGDKVKFDNNITVLGFWGDDMKIKKSDGFNLNQKIYKRFFEFKDFQFVFVVKNENYNKLLIQEFKEELNKGMGTDLSKWKFIFGDQFQILELFKSLKSDLNLSDLMSTSTVFIIDRSGNLRGRDDDEDSGTLFGYNSSSVAEINNKMIDDVKVILAEYRLALKKNNNLNFR